MHATREAQSSDGAAGVGAAIRPGVDPAERRFRTDHLDATLGRRTARSGATALASQACKFLLHLAGTVVLARLLAPEDYGLFAVVFAVVAFFSIFRESGLSAATVQSAEVTHAQVSALFWIGLALCAALALLTAASAPLVGWLYEDARFVPMTVALSAGFLFGAAGAQHRALLRRQMRIGVLSLVEVASFALGVVAAVAAALAGARYWALVVLHLTLNAATALGLWLACDWRPGRPARAEGVRPLVAFGGHLTGFEVVSYLARNADFLLIGWYWGARPLGFYDKAYQLMLLPVLHVALPLGSVVFPALSRLRDDAPRFRAYFDRCVLLTVATGMPLVAFLFVTADRAVPFVLGAQWAEAVPVFRALAPAAFVGPLYASVNWATASLGRTRRQLVWSLVSSSVTVCGFLVGLRWGAAGVAAAFSASRVLMLVPTLAYCYKDSPLGWTEALSNVARPALAAVLAAAALAPLDARLPATNNAALTLLLEGALYVVLYAAVWLATRGGRRLLRELLALSKELWRGDKRRPDV